MQSPAAESFNISSPPYLGQGLSLEVQLLTKGHGQEVCSHFLHSPCVCGPSWAKWGILRTQRLFLALTWLCHFHVKVSAAFPLCPVPQGVAEVSFAGDGCPWDAVQCTSSLLGWLLPAVSPFLVCMSPCHSLPVPPLPAGDGWLLGSPGAQAELSVQHLQLLHFHQVPQQIR